MLCVGVYDPAGMGKITSSKQQWSLKACFQVIVRERNPVRSHSWDCWSFMFEVAIDFIHA